VGISIETRHQNFTEKIQMRRVSAKFVPRSLIDDQKENRVEISQEFLANANGNENFLKNIITGDKTWIYGYDVETKMNRRSGWGKGLLDPKKALVSWSKSKTVVVFFDWKGIVHYEFVPRGQMVKKQLYQDVLARLRDVVCRKRPKLWENQI